MKKVYIILTLFVISLGTFIASCDKDTAVMGNGYAESNSGSNTGQGGSLARFTISGNHMYVVDISKLYVYNISNPATPALVKTIDVGFNIETIFPYEDKLFIGSQEAMYVFSIASPENPVKMGQASHLRACDPVVANDKVAYVTVRTGSNCGGVINALYVYNITNPQSPVEMNMLSMDNPHGLGLKDNVLYVCDGTSGLKIYKTGEGGDTYSVNYTTSRGGFTFYDCIPFDDLLICMIEGGTVLYDISDPVNPVQLAQIMNQ